MLKFITTYWVQLVFLASVLLAFTKAILWLIEGVKCSLRNDILQIYDNCKEQKEIHRYDLEAIELSSNLYFKLKGNSFVEDIVKEVRTYKKV